MQPFINLSEGRPTEWAWELVKSIILVTVESQYVLLIGTDRAVKDIELQTSKYISV